MCLVMIWFTWPWFVESYRLSEQSNNAGGLIRWPVKLMLPVGFACVALQGISEIIKNGASLAGYRVEGRAYEKPLQ
jgi:TRAP-type mannitol/chloroaromatic compound transport system permease small subunit